MKLPITDQRRVHLPNSLVDGRLCRQQRYLGACELSQAHLTLLARQLGAGERDLLLCLDRLRLDLAHQLSGH